MTSNALSLALSLHARAIGEPVELASYSSVIRSTIDAFDVRRAILDRKLAFLHEAIRKREGVKA